MFRMRSGDSYLFASRQHEIGPVELPRDLLVSAISSDFHDGVLRNAPAAILWLTSVLSATLCLIRPAGAKTGRIENKRLRHRLWPIYGLNEGQIIP